MEHDPFSLEVIHKFEEEVKEGIKKNHRRMFIFPDGITHEFYLKIIKTYFEIYSIIPVKILFASHDVNSIFQSIHSGLEPENFNVKIVEFPKINKILGQTFDLLVLDLTEQLKPNDLGILVETVKGGGVILVLTPNFETWKKSITFFQRTLITPPFSEGDLNFRFTPYFINNLEKYEGIIILDFLNSQIQKGTFSKSEPLSEKIEFHQTAPFNKIFYKIAITDDQKSFLDSLEFILQKDEKKRVIILTADRGRGKSAILGIGAVAISQLLIEKYRYPHVKILVTAPDINNTKVVMEFAEKALNALNLRVIIKKNALITRKITILYEDLIEAIEEKSDLTIVDESASISLPILSNLLENSKKIIFSSTLHGYEGAGRGFSILFRNDLYKKSNLKIMEIGMNEPIRYSLNDPIEQWLFDTLFLNAQPAQLNNDDMSDIANSNLEVKKIDLDRCFLDDEKEIFTNFAGIIVFAHYRNQPDDIVVLSDSPHHEAWAMFTETQKNIVNVVQVAEEGNLSEQDIQNMLKGKQFSGNILPWISITHFRTGELAKLNGARIVRIATHPDLFRQGLGSKMLSKIEEFYKNLDYDWIGTSFGLNPNLLDFWVKNGYSPFHLSSRITPSTGEYSIILIKSLSNKSEKIIRLLRQEFKFKIFEWFRTIFYNLPPKLAFSVLESTQQIEKPIIFNNSVTKIQKERLNAYFKGFLDYSNTSDVIIQILKYYFLNFEKDAIDLSKKQKDLIMMKCLQSRTWQQTLDHLNLKYEVANGLLRKAIRKISRV